MTNPPTRSGAGDSRPPADGSQTAEFSEPSPGGRKGAEWRTWAIASVAAVVIVVVGFLFLGSDDDGDAAGVLAAADANTEGGFPNGGGFPGGAGANGEVIGIEGSTLTVEARSGMSRETSTMTVETAADTEIVETVEGSADDLEVGDEITVVGAESGGVIAATTITEGGGLGGVARGGFRGGGGGPPEGFEGEGPPEGFEPPEGIEPGQGPGGQGRDGQGPGAAGGFVSGSIVSIDGTTLTLETDDGEVTVEVGDDTGVVVTKDRSFDDIEVGDSVQATGETDGSVVAASRIQIGSPGFGRGGPGGGLAPMPDNETSTG